MSDIVEVDNGSDLEVAVTAAYEDPTVADALEEMYRAEREITDADLEQMHAAAEADGIDPAPWHDLTGARYNELMSAYPEGTGWSPQITYDANADKPFVAELTRGTPNGPDVAHAGRFLTAECALMVAVAFAWDMVFAHRNGTDEQKAAIRAKITYAKR